MSQLTEYIKIAWLSIRNNKGRSFLTMIGIIIGISSVILIVAIGNGVKTSVLEGINGMFGGQLYIQSYEENEAGEYIWFTPEDVEAVRQKVSHVKAAMPVVNEYGLTTNWKRDYTTWITASSPDHLYGMPEPMLHGRYFSWEEYEDCSNVCVILEESAVNLFGNSNVVGETIEVTIGDAIVDLRIVGVRAKSDNTVKNMMYYYDEVEIEMPITTMDSLTGWGMGEEFNNFLVVAEAPEYSGQVAQDCIQLMEARKDVRGQHCITTDEFSTVTKQINSIINYITIFISLVAAVSLVVGGIGVMNIMLVSVTERTSEIGIRKALGARTGSIMIQFLAEAAMITLFGGLLGMLLGWGGAAFICEIASLLLKMEVVAY
ncbi:MAG: ABC transporter permease, partial [Lachnospiraceae bacterium]|nr:ABC transporter permease [Lachnospiraceae bacterium]